MRLRRSHVVAETRWTWSDFAYHSRDTLSGRRGSHPRTRIVMQLFTPLIWLVPWDSEAISIVSARRWNLQTLRLNLVGSVAVSQRGAVRWSHHKPHAASHAWRDRSRLPVGAPRGTTELAETAAIGSQHHLPHCARVPITMQVSFSPEVLMKINVGTVGLKHSPADARVATL